MKSNRAFLLAVPVFSLWLSMSAATNSLETTVDQLFSDWDHADTPGAAVVIVQDGRVVYERGYGSADLEHRIPISPQTVFNAASVSKQFTGLAIAMLIQQGTLSLDDDVRKYLPSVPDFGKPITIRHLLHHTSGLRDWCDVLALEGVVNGPFTQDTVLSMVRRQRELNFVPGEELLYSNTGYNLLALVVDRATKQSFRSWTDTNIFQPLGMKHTHFYDEIGEIIPNRACGYFVKRGTFFRDVRERSVPGAGSLMISAEDMGRWLLNLDNSRVGGRAALELMQQTMTLNNRTNVPYGFGLRIDEFRGFRILDHSGDGPGFRNTMMWIPQKRFGVGILSNCDDVDACGAAEQIAGIYVGLPAGRRTMSATGSNAPPPTAKSNALKSNPPEMSSTNLPDYAGDYWSDELKTVYQIAIRGGRLTTWHSGIGFMEFQPAGPDCFAENSKLDLKVQFTRNKAGEVTGMKFSTDRARNLRFTRVSLPKMERPKAGPSP